MSRTWNEYEKAGLRHCVFFLHLRNCSDKKFKTHAAVPPWTRFVLTIISPLNGGELFGRFQNWKLINDTELYIAEFVLLRFSFKP